MKIKGKQNLDRACWEKKHCSHKVYPSCVLIENLINQYINMVFHKKFTKEDTSNGTISMNPVKNFDTYEESNLI